MDAGEIAALDAFLDEPELSLPGRIIK